jgi:hypothetical protein
LSSFDTVEVLAEFSKAIRHGLISLESLRDQDGIDAAKIGQLADSVRCVHLATTGYLASVLNRRWKMIELGVADLTAQLAEPTLNEIREALEAQAE